jgi:hypothetical protein
MNNFLLKYFKNSDDGQNIVNPPASIEEIANLEKKLDISLPTDYKEFLQFFNGYEGLVNEFVVIFTPVNKIFQETQNYCTEFFPWAVYIGSNGNLEMYVIDKRTKPYQFGLLTFIASDDDFIALGDTFEKFLDRLYNDTAFD